MDGVDYVFVDHACFNTRGADLYGGTREDLMFRCNMLSKAALEAVSDCTTHMTRDRAYTTHTTRMTAQECTAQECS